MKTDTKIMINHIVLAVLEALLLIVAFGSFFFRGFPGAAAGLGAFLTAVLIIIQYRKWWVKERERKDHTDILERIIRCAASSNDPDENINSILGLLGEEFKAGRAFVFEDLHDGTYSNTYEWCAEGVEPKAGDFAHVPFKGHVEIMLDDMRRHGRAVVKNISNVDKGPGGSLTETLARYDVKNTIAAPLELNGEAMGFCGVDNVPESAGIEDAEETVTLLAYFFSQLILQRDNNKRLQRFGFNDLMTGVGNRRAFERYKKEWIDTGNTYGYVMCDINGLKMVNDMQGHEAGDSMIKDVASCLAYIFGEENVFRMGGDEFVSIYTDGDEVALRKKIDGVRVMLRHKDRSASIGYVYCQDGSIPYEEVKIKADKLMYMEKEEYYSGKNDRRRRKRQ